jgi:SNF2 family DNA or RNA helicase
MIASSPCLAWLCCQTSLWVGHHLTPLTLLLPLSLQVDMAQLEAAHHMLAPFCLRRLKREVELSLPPLVETRISCPLSAMQTFWVSSD